MSCGAQPFRKFDEIASLILLLRGPSEREIEDESGDQTEENGEDVISEIEQRKEPQRFTPCSETEPSQR